MYYLVSMERNTNSLMSQTIKNLLARGLSSIPGSERSPGEGNGNPLQYSCLENSVDRGTWWATVHGVAESVTTEQLSLSEKTMV